MTLSFNTYHGAPQLLWVNPYRMNYHQVVFRAQDETARLTLADWAGDRDPGGPVGEELIWNFMQVQPYFGE